VLEVTTCRIRSCASAGSTATALGHPYASAIPAAAHTYTSRPGVQRGLKGHVMLAYWADPTCLVYDQGFVRVGAVCPCRPRMVCPRAEGRDCSHWSQPRQLDQAPIHELT
jgi:hypothetical protein